MGKSYLFSPVGNTDPIKYFHDGSMLHICRHYKPDKVYLYLSREMLLLHNEDNRYVKTLELLGERLHHEFDIHIIEATDMVEVQQYDVFYEEFRKIIAKIEEEKEADDTVLVNMASGTPAMKSALLVMATLAEYRFLPIQVSTPKKSSNLEYEERKDYDVEENWELDEDNEEGAIDRCQEVKCLNLMRLLKIDIIKKHLRAYDYHAAFQIAKDIREDLSRQAYQWLEAADARSLLDWDRLNKIVPGNAGAIIRAVRDEKRSFFEYTLALDLKIKRGEYADFLRAITPLGVDLLEWVIDAFCDLNIRQYYKKGDSRKWDKEKLYDTEILNDLKGDYLDFNYGPVYSIQLSNLIQKRCTNDLVKRRVQELVEVEQKVRNIAAHNIVSVTQAWIKSKTGKSADEIMWIIKYLCEQVKINVQQENWKAYDLMNQRIMEELER